MNPSRITRALSLIEGVAHHIPQPVLFVSFGKDSLALLSLAETAGLDLPVAYFELGVRPEKHRFAREMAETTGRSVTFLRPVRTVGIAGESSADLGYEIELLTGDRVTIVGATLVEAEAAQMACAITDAMVIDGPQPPYPWDTILCGRKNTDFDATVGSLAWQQPQFNLPRGGRIVMPLIDWTDADVSDFLRERKIAFDVDRYSEDGGVIRQSKDNYFNPDHLDCCTRCVLARRGETVCCPKTGEDVIAFAGVERISYEAEGAVSPAFMF